MRVSSGEPLGAGSLIPVTEALSDAGPNTVVDIDTDAPGDAVLALRLTSIPQPIGDSYPMTGGVGSAVTLGDVWRVNWIESVVLVDGTVRLTGEVLIILPMSHSLPTVTIDAGIDVFIREETFDEGLDVGLSPDRAI